MSLKRSSAARAARLSPVALALVAGGLQVAHAEDLVQVYNAARAYDASYLSARALTDSAEYAAAQTKAGLLPQVNATATANRNGAFDTGIPNNDTVSGNETTARINGRQPLYAPGASVLIKQAYKRLDEAHIALEAAEQDLVVRVAAAYFEVLSAQDTLGTANANKKAIGEQLASAKRNFEVGTATITDTREAQARYDLATATVISAENDLRTRQIALDQLVGRGGVVPNPLASTQLPTVEPADPQKWVDAAIANNPAVRRASLETEVAQLETERAKTGHLPTVDVVASAGTDHAWGALPQFGGSSGTSKTATVGLQLNVPLFSGFAVQNRVRETVKLLEKTQDDLDFARRDAEQRTRTAYFTVQSIRAQVSALEAAQASSRLALEATQLGYKVGVRVNLDVLNAQNQLNATERDLSRARYDVLVGDLRLRQAAGTLKPDDLAAINSLLVKR